MLEQGAIEISAPTGEGTPKGRSDLVRRPGRGSSVPRRVGEILRAPADAGEGGRDPADVLDRAAAGAAISILAACASDDGVGPLPELSSGLVEMLLDGRHPAE